MPRFKYNSLESPTREIYLLSVAVGNDLEDIQCSSSVASLDDNPTYIAISYEWGEPEPLIDIQVNGNRFSVRHNLFLLLQYLASHAGPSHLPRPYHFWIDAICINQVDDTEKSLQVRNMGRIYSQAELVLAWLGWPSDWDLKSTFQFIRSHAAPLLTPDGPVLIPQHRKSEEDRGNDFYQEILVNGLPHSKALRKLCECSYWSRRWIVQELILASNVEIVCGGESLTLETLGQCIQAITWTVHKFSPYNASQTSNRDRPMLPLSVECLWDTLSKSIPYQLWKDRDTKRYGGQTVKSIPELLKSYGSTKCELLHDLIFSLAALATGRRLEIDYSWTTLELFCRLHQQEFYQQEYSNTEYPRHDLKMVADALELPYTTSNGLEIENLHFLNYETQLHSCVLRTASADDLPMKVLPEEAIRGRSPSVDASYGTISAVTVRESTESNIERGKIVEAFPVSLGMIAHPSENILEAPSVSYAIAEDGTLQSILADIKQRWGNPSNKLFAKAKTKPLWTTSAISILLNLFPSATSSAVTDLVGWQVAERSQETLFVDTTTTDTFFCVLNFKVLRD